MARILFLRLIIRDKTKIKNIHLIDHRNCNTSKMVQEQMIFCHLDIIKIMGIKNKEKIIIIMMFPSL